MDALVTVLGTVAAVLAMAFAFTLLAHYRLSLANERLKWILGRVEGERDGAVEQAGVLRKLIADLTRQNTTLEQQLVLATRSQHGSQEMQPEAPEVVRTLPVAAGRLAHYVKEQAMAVGRQLSDYEAEQMAASMLVESGI